MRRLFAISSKVQVLSLNSALLVLSGCGAITLGGRPSATCPPNTAQIEVYDTGMRRGCGCTEGASSQLFVNPNSFNCTIPLGTTVYFTYVAIQDDHFIGITPGGSGVGNCVFQFRGPNSAGAVDACQPAGTGTYTFTDQQTFNSGQLIVTP